MTITEEMLSVGWRSECLHFFQKTTKRCHTYAHTSFLPICFLTLYAFSLSFWFLGRHIVNNNSPRSLHSMKKGLSWKWWSNFSSESTPESRKKQPETQLWPVALKWLAIVLQGMVANSQSDVPTGLFFRDHGCVVIDLLWDNNTVTRHY